MTVMVKCVRAPVEEPVFIGPFSTESEADDWLSLPTYGVSAGPIVDFCNGKHEIVTLVAPDRERKFSELAVRRAIQRAVEKQKSATIAELASKVRPFIGTTEGIPSSWPVTFDNLTGRKIATIKTLRMLYPGLGLKEAKDIVDGWQRDLEPILAL